MGQFIHALWGDTKASFRRRGGSRHSKAIRDLMALAHCSVRPSATIYCFGEKNEALARNYGFVTRLCDPSPVVFTKHQFWRHKVACWQFALQDFGCPVIHMDMDVRQVAEIPGDHWERMLKRDSIQAVMEQFRGIKIRFRKYDRRKVNSGKFVYLRTLKDAQDVDRQFFRKEGRDAWDETAITSVITDRVAPWEDDGGEALRRCIDRHEPYCAVSRRQGDWKHFPEYKDTKEKIFFFPAGMT